MNSITLKQLNLTYGANTPNETVALKDISLEIKKGDFMVLVGSNGSGKSSLLNCIAGVVRVDKGEIYFGNDQVQGLPEYRRSKWIGRVFQNPLAGTAPDLTVMDNFRLASLRTQKKGFRLGTDAAFKKMVKEKISKLGLGLENKTEQSMGSLSGGQRQALTLLMAVMDKAGILLMDEPTAALDPKTAEVIMKLADKIVSEFLLTVILVTHQVKFAHAYGNRIVLMEEGKISRDLGSNEKARLTVNDLYEWF